MNMAPTIDTYKPVFMEDNEQIFVQTGLRQPVNPQVCLTPGSADELVTLLADLNPRIVEADPTPVISSSIYFKSLVPWLVFPSGAAENAAGLAMFWHRTTGKSADQQCRQAIQQVEQTYTAEGDSNYPTQLKAAPK
jgi:hypothetical protein